MKRQNTTVRRSKKAADVDTLLAAKFSLPPKSKNGFPLTEKFLGAMMDKYFGSD